MNENNSNSIDFNFTSLSEKNEYVHKIKNILDENIKRYCRNYPEDLSKYCLDIVDNIFPNKMEKFIDQNRPHLFMYDNLKATTNPFKRFLEGKDLKKIMEDGRRLFNGLYIELINNQEISAFDKIKYGNLFKILIENLSQIENFNFDKKYFGIIDFINLKNKEIENANDYGKIDKHLIWNPKYLSKLPGISDKLFILGYTENEEAFEEVFTKYIRINWKKNVDFLVVLIDELFKDPRKLLSISHNNKGIREVPESFFRDISRDGKGIISFRNRIHRFNTPVNSQSDPTRLSVKKLIEEFI